MRSYNGLKLFVASTFLASVLVGCKTPVKNIVATQSSTNYPTSVLTTPFQPATNEPKPTIESITQTYTPVTPTSTSTQVTPTPHSFIDDAVVFNYGGLGRSVWEMSPDEGVEYTVKVNGVEGKCYSVNFDFENPNTKSLPEKVESKYANGIFCTSQCLSVNKWHA